MNRSSENRSDAVSLGTPRDSLTITGLRFPSLLRRVLQGGVVCLALLLPFEFKAPVLAVGPLAVTNVELALYALLALWLLSRPHVRVTPAHVAVLAWLIVMWVSAAAAPAERVAAVKFALRSTGGGMLAFAVADLVPTPRAAALVLLSLAAGAMLAAGAALAEMWLPGASTLLLVFKTQVSQAGSYLRASGTFQYANIGAMYWEAGLPLVIVAIAYVWEHIRRGRRYVIAAGALGVLILTQAIVLTASRAGLAVAVLVLAMLAAASYRLRLPLWRAQAGAVALVISVAALNVVGNPLFALRLRSENDASWYQAEYTPTPLPKLSAGQEVTTTVAVRNAGVWTWRSMGDQPVNLSYHWRLAGTGELVVFEGLRANLPADVAPGEQVVLTARVLAPAVPGAYLLHWDMVHEGVIWFSSKGAATGDVAVNVVAGAATSQPPLVPQVSSVPAVLPQPSRAQLWAAGLRMWWEHPLLGVGPDNFRHLYGPYVGPGQFDDRTHANSLYVETLATLGLPGIVALAALPAALAWMAWRGLRRRDAAARLLLTGLLAALAAFYVHGLVDYFQEFTPTYLQFWLLVGIVTGLLARRRSPSVEAQVERIESGIDRF